MQAASRETNLQIFATLSGSGIAHWIRRGEVRYSISTLLAAIHGAADPS